MVALLGLTLEVCGTTCDHVKLMAHPVADERVQAQCTRHAVDQCQHVGTESLLQLRVLIQIVENHLRHGVTLEYEHESLTGTSGGFVTHIGDALDFAVTHRFTDGYDQSIWVHLIWQFGDHQAHAALDFLGVYDRTHGDQASTGTVGLFDALVTENRRTGREIRPLDNADQIVEQFFAAGFRMVQCPMHAFGHLTHVVRRDIGGHADGDAGRSIAEQVREAGRQHGRLLGLAIVVR